MTKEEPKRRGRPPGSKNKPKVIAAPVQFTDDAQDDKEEVIEPDLVVSKDAPRRGRPPGTKNKKKKGIDLVPFLSMPIWLDVDGKPLDPRLPGAELKRDTRRSTLGQVVSTAPLYGVSYAVEEFDKKNAKKEGRKPKKALKNHYPDPMLAMIQSCFDELVKDASFELHPGWALLICYGATLVTGFFFYMAEKSEPIKLEVVNDRSVGREVGGGNGSPSQTRRSPDDSSSRQAWDGEDDFSQALRRENGTEETGP